MASSTAAALYPVRRSGNVLVMERALPNRLREWRRARGWTLEALAAEVGTTNQTLSRYERGARSITIDLLEQLAPVLGCKPADLLPDPESVLGAEERDLLRRYQELAPEDRAVVQRIVRGLEGGEPEAAAPRLRRRLA